jgi:excisionase family DNA binding protein
MITPAIPPRAAYSIPEVMCALGLCRDSIYKLINSKRLPAKKIGRRTVVTAVDLQRFLDDLPTIGDGA